MTINGQIPSEQLAVRRRAQDRAAQSTVRNALTAAKTIFVDSESYEQSTPAALRQVEPSLKFIPNEDSTGPTEVSVYNVSETEIRLASRSEAGTCFAVRDKYATTADAGATYARKPVGNPAHCSAKASFADGDFRPDGWA